MSRLRPLEQKKLLTIIAPAERQRMIVERLKKIGIGGYTVVSATGAGSTGLRTGMFDSDSSVVIYVIMSEQRLIDVLNDVDAMMRRGSRLKAFAQDISILPRKFEAPK